MDENQANKVRPPLPWHRGFLYAFFITLIFVTALEILCRQFFSPYRYPPFEKQPGTLAGSVLITFTLNEHHPAFEVPKPKNRFRIMFFGESALEGFLGRGFPAWFQALAEATHPARTIEALNFGVGGTTSTAIRDWFFPALEMAPDLLVLYIGNNELDFTSVINPTDHPLLYGLHQLLHHHSRLYQVLEQFCSITRIKLFMNSQESRIPSLAETRPLFPVSQRLRIEEVYRNNLRDMMMAAKEKGIPGVVISPAANLKDWPPMQSAHYSTLTPEALRAFEQSQEKGRQHLREGDIEESKVALEAALSIDPTYAEPHYLYAEALASLKDWDGARKHYQLARDWDDLPERAPRRMIAIDLDLARAAGFDFLELDQRLGQASSPPIAGFDMFYDSVHFTDRGEYEVARALLQELTAWKLVPGCSDPVPTFDELLPRLSLPKDQTARENVEKALILTLKPNRSRIFRQAVRNLEEAKSGLSTSPLPALLQAILLGQMDDGAGAKDALAQAYQYSSYSTAVAASRFFPDNLEIYQKQAVMCFKPDINWNLIAQQVISYFKTPHPKALLPPEFGTIPLESMKYAFTWDDARQGFADATFVMNALVRERERELEVLICLQKITSNSAFTRSSQTGIITSFGRNLLIRI